MPTAALGSMRTVAVSFSLSLTCLLGGKYTKDDFRDYEKSMETRSKLALKDQVKSKQEYPSVSASELKSPPKILNIFKKFNTAQQSGCFPKTARLGCLCHLSVHAIRLRQKCLTNQVSIRMKSLCRFP